MTGTIIEEVYENQCFRGTLIRGAKDSVEKFIEELKQQKSISWIDIDERKPIGSGDVLLKMSCIGFENSGFHSDEYKDLAFAIFTTSGTEASLYVKKAGSTELIGYVLGEVDTDTDGLQIYTEYPDKTIWEIYVLCCCGECVEFKYEPSAYVLSMVNDATLDENASAEPKASCEYIENYDDKVCEEGCVVYI